MEAASAASARPTVNTSTKWSSPPAPPEAITGIETAVETAVETRLRAIAVDRRQEDLAGAAVLGLTSPFDSITVCWQLSAAGVDGEPIAHRLRVDRDDHGLASVAVGERGDEGRLRERGRVQAHLVGAGVDRHFRVGLGPDAA